MAVRVAKAAQVELHQAALRLEKARRGYGTKFRQAYVNALDQLDRIPEFFPRYEDAPEGFDVRIVHLKRYKYQIVYATFGMLKLVVAISHDAQQPGYWLDRLARGDHTDTQA